MSDWSRGAGGEIRAVAREQLLVALAGIPRLLRHRVWRDADAGQGNGQGVMLVPGFGFGERSLELLAMWLRARGYRPLSAGIGLNLGCTTTMVERIEQRLDRHGAPAVLIGQSRGGWLARIVAARRPELVRGLVMLASPVLDPLGAHPKVVRVARALTRLSTLGVPGLLTEDCLSGTCFTTQTAALAAPLTIPAVSVYSRSDAIVPWRLCLDPGAEYVEVGSSHTGMGLDPDVFTALQPRLAGWARIRPPAAVRTA